MLLKFVRLVVFDANCQIKGVQAVVVRVIRKVASNVISDREKRVTLFREAFKANIQKQEGACIHLRVVGAYWWCDHLPYER
jgi:hypothetical protein